MAVEALDASGKIPAVVALMTRRSAHGNCAYYDTSIYELMKLGYPLCLEFWKVHTIHCPHTLRCHPIEVATVDGMAFLLVKRTLRSTETALVMPP